MPDNRLQIAWKSGILNAWPTKNDWRIATWHVWHVIDSSLRTQYL